MQIIDLHLDVLEKIFKQLDLHDWYNCSQAIPALNPILKEIRYDSEIRVANDNLYIADFVAQVLKRGKVTFWDDAFDQLSKETRKHFYYHGETNFMDLNFDVLEQIFQNLDIEMWYELYHTSNGMKNIVRQMRYNKMIHIRDNNLYLADFICTTIKGYPQLEVTFWNNCFQKLSDNTKSYFQYGRDVKVYYKNSNSGYYPGTVGGGLIQLVASGTKDLFLTGEPQVTFWKASYKRHNNFALDSIEPISKKSSPKPKTGRNYAKRINNRSNHGYRRWHR